MDGTTFDVVDSPANKSVVGQDAGSTRLGVAMSVHVFAPDGTLVETVFAKPGNQPAAGWAWLDAPGQACSMWISGCYGWSGAANPTSG
jgi:hypothetical protein